MRRSRAGAWSEETITYHMSKDVVQLRESDSLSSRRDCAPSVVGAAYSHGENLGLAFHHQGCRASETC